MKLKSKVLSFSLPEELKDSFLREALAFKSISSFVRYLFLDWLERKNKLQK